MAHAVMTTAPKSRGEFDAYETPAALVRAALGLLPRGFSPSLVVDPGAGLGVWAREARLRWPDAPVWAIELQDAEEPPSLYESGRHAIAWLPNTNYLEENPSWFYGREDSVVGSGVAIVGNPPFSIAEEFIRHSIQVVNAVGQGGIVLFLLRLAFLESAKRANGLWQEYPPAEVWVLNQRPSFYGSGKTDQVAYAMFLWKVDTLGFPSPAPVLRWLSWR